MHRDYDDGPRPDTDDVQIAMAPRSSYPLDLHSMVEQNMSTHRLSGYATDKAESLRRAAKLFAHTIVDQCPPGDERVDAIRHAELALMLAVASVARHQ